jgi:hypothetical protein
MEQGFDYCYDKKLYDRLANENAQAIIEHLKADWQYQSRLIRFIENHDEERAVNIFGKEASKAAAVITLTLPGARLVFEGQTHGHQVKLPVQLKRKLAEKEDKELTEYYNKLLQIIPGKRYNNAKWSLCEVLPLNSTDVTHNNIIAYQWILIDQYLIIVVNYSLMKSRAHIKMGNIDYGTFKWKFNDLLNNKEYNYKGQDLKDYGLYVELDDWKAHVFEVRKPYT